MIALIFFGLLAYPLLSIGFDMINTNYSNCNTLCNSNYLSNVAYYYSHTNIIDTMDCKPCIFSTNICSTPKNIACFYTTFYTELMNKNKQNNSLYNSLYNILQDIDKILLREKVCTEHNIIHCVQSGYKILLYGFIIIIIGIFIHCQ